MLPYLDDMVIPYCEGYAAFHRKPKVIGGVSVRNTALSFAAILAEIKILPGNLTYCKLSFV